MKTRHRSTANHYFQQERRNFLGVALALLGSGGLSINISWCRSLGLGLLALGISIYLAGYQARRVPAAPMKIKINRKILVIIGLGVSLLCGAGLTLFFSHREIHTSQWRWIGLLAGCALAGLVTAALSISARPNYKSTLSAWKLSPWKSGFFWGSCLLIFLLHPFFPMITPLGFGLMVLSAPDYGKDPESPSNRYFQVLCLLLGAVGLGLHLYDLNLIPQGINWEEHYVLTLSQPLQYGKSLEVVINSVSFSGITLYHQVVAWISNFFVHGDVLPLRLISVLGWAVLAVYGTLLSASLFSWRAALGSAAYFCLAFFALHYGRFGFYFIWAPAAGAGALAHTVFGLRSRYSALHLTLAGLWCAVVVYGWVAGWIVPGIVLAYLLGTLAWNKKAWKAMIPSLACGLAAFLAFSAGGMSAYLGRPGGITGLFQGNSSSLLSAEGEASLGGNLLVLLKQIAVTGTNSPMHYLPGLALVSTPVLCLVLAGLGMTLKRPREGRGVAILACCFFGFLPAWLSNPDGMNLGRLIMLLLPLGLLMGAGWSALVKGLRHLSRGLNITSEIPATLAGLLLLGLTLGLEPKLYFHDYRNNSAAIFANFGHSSYVIKSIRDDLRADENFFYSERFIEASSLIPALPRFARPRSLREAPDFAYMMGKFPKGALLSGPARRDWQNWLRSHMPNLTIKTIKDPWPKVGISSKKNYWKTTEKETLADLWQWDGKFQGLGLKHTGPGRWEGYLWISQPDRYLISTSVGTLFLDGHHQISWEKPKSFQLQAVPFSVRVENSLVEPYVMVKIPNYTSDNPQWKQPLFSEMDFHGLRKTLRSKDGDAQSPTWISLAPVISQHFANFGYEPGEGPVHFPFTGLWEGTLRVPLDGNYVFRIPNTCTGNVELELDKEVIFQSLRGEETLNRSRYLKPGRDYALQIYADEISPENALRFLVKAPGQDEKPVPSQWLRPAPLPAPIPLP